MKNAILTGFALCLAAPLAAQGLVESYTVNAQYRGGVKKGFQDLGSGKVAYEPLGGAAFRVRAKGEVRHPEEDKDYAFKIYERFEVQGNAVRTTAVEKKELNEHARAHEGKITEVLPFAYLVRQLPVPAGDGDASRTFNYQGQQYTLRYRMVESKREVDLYRGETFLGKFFLESDPAPGRMAKLEKFRIALPEEDLVVSFVVNSSYAMAGSTGLE